ncbi:MAG: FTR1 family protein [Pararobbsia sp.]
MGQILFIVWRESVEALLVVGILYAWLRNGDAMARERAALPLGRGWRPGYWPRSRSARRSCCSPRKCPGMRRDYFQIAMVLVACVLVVQMVLWMRHHGRTLKRDMEASLAENTRNANWWGITLLVALAIAREGSETVIFLYGIGLGQSGHVDGSQVVAIALGLGLALLTFYVLQLGGKFFSWRLFFRVTEIMLFFLAAGLFELGVDKLIDKELLPAGHTLWDTSWLLDDSHPVGGLVATLTGYRAHPAMTNLVAYVVYWAVIWALLRYVRPAAAQPQSRPA